MAWNRRVEVREQHPKATDIGALGIVVATVDTVEKAMADVGRPDSADWRLFYNGPIRVILHMMYTSASDLAACCADSWRNEPLLTRSSPSSY